LQEELKLLAKAFNRP